MPLLPPLLGAAAGAGSGPFWILLASIALVVVAITWMRLPAFVALMFAALVAGGLVALSQGGGSARGLAAVAHVTEDFGVAIGRIGFTIALAAIIGGSLMASGAADQIVRRLIAWFGERQAAAALLVSAFLLSAPVFVDTVLLLLFPIARALSIRTGGNRMLYLLAVGAGALLANGTIPPAPGPLLMAETLRLNLGLVFLAGLAFDLIPALASLRVARWFDSHVPVSGKGDAQVLAGSAPETAAESARPGFGWSVLPVALPFVLIGAASLAGLPAVRPHLPAGLGGLVRFIGDKNLALALGAVAAVTIHARCKRLGWAGVGAVMSKSLETAAMIILIIGAGSAYGKMIERSGLGQALAGLTGGHGLGLVLLGWALAAIMRVAQGSATVAVITAMGVVAAMAGSAGYGLHPLYLFLAIGFGSKFMPWMNDVSFWLFCRTGGLTPGETARGWTLFSSVISVIGLIEVLVAATLWPRLPF